MEYKLWGILLTILDLELLPEVATGMVGYVLDAGANVSAVSPAGHVVLHIAADVGNYALCQTLVQGGADVNVLSGVYGRK